MPFSLLRSRLLVVTNVTAGLSAAAMFATFFLTLYLQRVLGKSPLQVALIFLPTCLISAVLALGFSARIVNRYRDQAPLRRRAAAGRARTCAARRNSGSGRRADGCLPGHDPVHDRRRVLPAVHCSCQRCTGSPPKDSGLASGLVGTSSMIGGSLGLAILAAVCGGVDPQPRSTGCRSNGCADRWLPRGLRHRCGVSCRVCSAGAAVASRHYSTFCTRCRNHTVNNSFSRSRRRTLAGRPLSDYI